MANWSAGGENSIAGNAYLNASLTHKKGNWLWVTNMVLDALFIAVFKWGVAGAALATGLSQCVGCGKCQKGADRQRGEGMLEREVSFVHLGETQKY
mgnify:CR=1 FL=1